MKRFKPAGQKLTIGKLKVSPWMFIAAFAVIGIITLLLTHAATSTSNLIEPEAGTKSGNYSLVTDVNASGGKAIKFQAAAATCPAGQTGTPPNCVPATCPTGTTGTPPNCVPIGGNCPNPKVPWSNLEACGWPGPTNTGVPAGTTLTASGSKTITAANTVIDGQLITGNITVNAKGVIIRNSRINYTGNGGGGSGGIKILANATVTIQNVEINGQSSVHSCIWYEGASMIVRNVNCHHVEDGMFSWFDSSTPGSDENFDIADSYIHDLAGSESNGHLDGWQTEGSANGVIRHNTFRTAVGGSSTSIIAIWNTQKSSHHITVENNLMAGGGFAVYAEDYSPSEASPAGGNTVTNITIKDNKFSTNMANCVGDYGVWFFRSAWLYQGGPTDGWNKGGSSRTGNIILETGANVDSGNPPGCG